MTRPTAAPSTRPGQVLGGQPSGRVMAVQIKAGASWFAEETPPTTA